MSDHIPAAKDCEPAQERQAAEATLAAAVACISDSQPQKEEEVALTPELLAAISHPPQPGEYGGC